MHIVQKKRRANNTQTNRLAKFVCISRPTDIFETSTSSRADLTKNIAASPLPIETRITRIPLHWPRSACLQQSTSSCIRFIATFKISRSRPKLDVRPRFSVAECCRKLHTDAHEVMHNALLEGPPIFTKHMMSGQIGFLDTSALRNMDPTNSERL